MEQKSKKNWLYLVMNGVISILIGVFLLLFQPDQMKVLVLYFGIVMVVIGVFMLFTAIRQIRQNKSAGMLLTESILTLVIGLIMMLFPTFSFKLFMILIGVWAIVIGIFQLAILISIKHQLKSKNILLFNGLLTIVLGVLLFFDPITTALFFLKIIGVFAVIFGILMIYFGIVLKMIKPVVSESLPPEN